MSCYGCSISGAVGLIKELNMLVNANSFLEKKWQKIVGEWDLFRRRLRKNRAYL